MRNFLFILTIVAFFLFFSPFYADILEKRDLRLKGYYFVSYVIDGDTIIVEKDGKKKTIRLIGVDAPEVRSRYRKKSECFGQEAKNFLKNKIEGKYVIIEKDSLIFNKDRYGRFLRYLYFEEIFNSEGIKVLRNEATRVFINKELIKQGYAFSFVYEKHKFLDDFLRLEKEAKMNNAGLWEVCY